MWYTSGSGRIELQITRDTADNCNHPGPCDQDVAEAMQIPAIRRQLQRIDAKVLREDLSEYGCWNEEELADHKQNLARILWIACGDIMEREYEKAGN